MTCKDCYHCRACHEMYLLAVAQEDDFFERHDAETCEDFVNKADIVEVVRCADCENCKSLTDQFDNVYYFCMLSANKAKVEADGFCSSGRRDT